MFYKLSNTSNRSTIEHEFRCAFLHPELFESAPIINGLEEETIAVITQEKPETVSFAIWGMLPDTYLDDWKLYQKSHNTLNVNIKELATFTKNIATPPKRCLIITTGFFTSFIKDGENYPYFVKKKSGKPYLLAGIYNVLADGFLTCSLVLTEGNSFVNNIHNIGNLMPLVVPKKAKKEWLEAEKTIEDNRFGDTISLEAFTINKEFFKINILSHISLEPFDYEYVQNYYVSDNLS